MTQNHERTLCSHETVELFFYGELGAEERARVHAHVSVCAECRQSLEDLRAIDEALAARAVETPPAGDWSGFMGRLNDALDRDQGRSKVGRLEGRAAGGSRHLWLRIAAAVALVASGALAGWTLSRLKPETAPAVAGAPGHQDAAIAAAGESGIDRARLVLAGLANKDQGAEWSIEQRMAATLLPEVTLIRQAAASRGRTELEDILKDVETLLLQASYAPSSDASALEELRGMIDRRDLLVRLSMAATTASASQPGTD